MSLDTLKSVLSTAGEHLGDLLWWTLFDARIDRASLEPGLRFAAGGVPPGPANR